MEGRHSRWSSQPRPRDLLRKIREFALAMIEDLSIGRSPEIFIDRFRNYCTNPDSNWVLLIIQQLLQENRHGSKAWFGTEVILKKFFLKHNNTKPALRGISITCILLYFQVSVGKGYCQCSSVHTCCGERISFYYFYGCFSSQGRGYPDIPTRRFLGLLVDTLHLPIYCLVDCDPYGFDILSMYRLLLHCNEAQVYINLTHSHCYVSKWSMMQNFYASPRYSGLEPSLRTQTSTVFHNSVSFI
ncbi:meiotic recombination protein SPO11-1-like isoform X3 [Malus sylvestris]|uniref:meiotic recombination protein SPO11-1-like isoform X3 n=1 Tax=Malus sylvestris TaxID=3752 RepID=UPI0021ABE5BF|nr:meiotic recombination protein SPO11-1-like isoform X3 [Malus sylvestris]